MAVNRLKTGRWRVQVYDPITRTMRHVGVYDLKREAQAAERDAATRMAGKGESVGSFAGRWIDDYPRQKQSTNLHNSERISKFVAQYERRRMDEVDRSLAARWCRERPGDLAALRAMWNDAAREGIVTANPFSALRLPGSRGRRDLPPGWLTASDVAALEQAALDVHGPWGPTCAALIRTCAYVGVRAGEAFGLDVVDPNYKDGTIRIARSVCSKTGVLQAPKSGIARTVAMPGNVADALRPLTAERTAGALFPGPQGKRLRGPAWSYHWRPVKSIVGRPDMALHELRHLCATMLVEAGLQPWQVAAQLGHRDGGTLVAEVYGHPSDAMARDAVHRAFGAPADA